MSLKHFFLASLGGGDLSCRQHDRPNKTDCIKMVYILGREAKVETLLSGMFLLLC